MNYYWWKCANGNVGNVYAENEGSAKEKVENEFKVVVVAVELLKKDVTTNHLTGKDF